MDATTLLADRVDGSRRTAVLKLDDESLSVRAKLYDDDATAILQVRAWIDSLGIYHHTYIDMETGGILVITTGTQDGDAFDRAKQELRRRGIDLT